MMVSDDPVVREYQDALRSDDPVRIEKATREFNESTARKLAEYHAVKELVSEKKTDLEVKRDEPSSKEFTPSREYKAWIALYKEVNRLLLDVRAYKKVVRDHYTRYLKDKREGGKNE